MKRSCLPNRARVVKKLKRPFWPVISERASLQDTVFSVEIDANPDKDVEKPSQIHR